MVVQSRQYKGMNHLLCGRCGKKAPYFPYVTNVYVTWATETVDMIHHGEMSVKYYSNISEGSWGWDRDVTNLMFEMLLTCCILLWIHQRINTSYWCTDYFTNVTGIRTKGFHPLVQVPGIINGPFFRLYHTNIEVQTILTDALTISQMSHAYGFSTTGASTCYNQWPVFRLCHIIIRDEMFICMIQSHTRRLWAKKYNFAKMHTFWEKYWQTDIIIVAHRGQH